MSFLFFFLPVLVFLLVSSVRTCTHSLVLLFNTCESDHVSLRTSRRDKAVFAHIHLCWFP